MSGGGESGVVPPEERVVSGLGAVDRAVDTAVDNFVDYSLGTFQTKPPGAGPRTLQWTVEGARCEKGIWPVSRETNASSHPWPESRADA